MEFPSSLPPAVLKLKAKALSDEGSHESGGTVTSLQTSMISGESNDDVDDEVGGVQNRVKVSESPEHKGARPRFAEPSPSKGKRVSARRPVLGVVKDLLGASFSNLSMLNLNGASKDPTVAKSGGNGDRASLRRGSFLSFVSNSAPSSLTKARQTAKTMRSNGNESQNSRKQLQTTKMTSSEKSRSRFSKDRLDQSMQNMKSSTRSPMPKLQQHRLSFSRASLVSRPLNGSLRSGRRRPSVDTSKRLISEMSMTEIFDERDMEYRPCVFEPEDDDADRKLSEQFYRSRLGNGSAVSVKNRKYSLFEDNELLKPRRISRSMLSTQFMANVKPEKNEDVAGDTEDI